MSGYTPGYTISMSNINTALNYGSTSQISLNDYNVRRLQLATSGIAAGYPGGGSISMASLRSKPGPDPAGTYESQKCSGYTLQYTYANGNWGSYTTDIQTNSTSCGYIPYPAYGTLLSNFCSGFNYYGRYANGSGGTYDSVITYNSPSCGYYTNLTGGETQSGGYSAQSGIAIYRYNPNGNGPGQLYLTVAVWPSDPPNYQHCSWTWLQNGGAENTRRIQTNTRPFWSMYLTNWGFENLTVGSGNWQSLQIPNWPYNQVPWTFQIRRPAANQLQIRSYPNSWGTGDNGTSVSVYNWWLLFQIAAGSPPQYQYDGSIWYDWAPNGITFSW